MAEPMPALNSSLPGDYLAGGDPMLVNVNLPYANIGYHAVWIMASSAIIWPIIPGIGLLYGGLANRKSSLALLWQSFMVIAVVTIQWWFIGYTLAFSRTASSFIGDFANIGFRDVRAAPSAGSGYIPDIVYAIFQCFFCVTTVQIMVGGAMERGHVVPSLVFAFLWATIVYCPIACWVWNANGWLFNLPSLDFAGGGPVHISSGFSALAYAVVLGKRKSVSLGHKPRPHNVPMVFIGTTFIWFGWICFNGGSALNATVRAMMAMWNTTLAAACGVVGWTITDYFRKKGKFSVVGACEGAIAGLVGITPAAGYVEDWGAAVIGLVTAVICASLENVTDWMGIDEGLDVWKLHGIGGCVGAFLTGVFATNQVAALDGFSTAPGAVDGNGIQVGYQMAALVSIATYAFCVSAAILFVMKYIPGMNLRVSDEAELNGLDLHHFGDEEVGDWAQSQSLDVMLGLSNPGTTGTSTEIKEEEEEDSKDTKQS